jgi:hypothetical protein
MASEVAPPSSLRLDNRFCQKLLSMLPALPTFLYYLTTG